MSAARRGFLARSYVPEVNLLPDETDLQLANLLQIDPRMPWARAGRIIGISATTAANRWKRLTDKGLAWIVTYPNLESQFTAFVDVDCRTESLPTAIHQLCRNPFVVDVDECTGERDILLCITTPDIATLSSLIIDWIGGLEGVSGTRSSLVTDMIFGSDSWRVNSLSRQQLREAAAGSVPARPAGGSNDGIDIALAEALARDGRASVASLAEQLDTPISTIQRRLTRLRAARQITMRCDLSPELSGLLLECTWLTTVAPNHKPRVNEFLRKETSIRSSVWTTGVNNLRFSFGVSHTRMLTSLEADIIRSLPGLAPAEILFYMRRHKSMGRILDSDGRATDELVVPVFSAGNGRH